MIEEVKESGWMKGATLLVPCLCDRWRGWLLSVCEPRQMRAGPWGLGFTCSTHALTGKAQRTPPPAQQLLPSLMLKHNRLANSV